MKPEYKKLIIAGLILIFVINAFTIIYIFLKKEEIKKPELNPPENNPSVTEPTEEDMSFLAGAERGEVGEIDEGSTGEEDAENSEKDILPPGMEIPTVVFNTEGTILEIKENSISVQGSGSNFKDQESRILEVTFNSKTKTLEEGKAGSWKGAEGLSYLFSGDKILIESFYNIRGKTEFPASYINKILEH